MKLTAAKSIPLTAVALALSFQLPSYAQTSDQISAPVIEQAIETIETPAKVTRAPSWQGKDVALRGRDVVSFFEDDKPRKGSKNYVADWDNTKWRFASEKNRDLFLKNPNRYVPEFGGYCPVALAANNAKIGKSKHFSVVNEKLYLNYNKSTYKQFQKEPDEYIVRAQLNF